MSNNVNPYRSGWLGSTWVDPEWLYSHEAVKEFLAHSKGIVAREAR